MGVAGEMGKPLEGCVGTGELAMMMGVLAGAGFPPILMTVSTIPAAIENTQNNINNNDHNGR